jgi:ADP-heptose:LPS heptosyltransferase/SAM-dependent methyltransferase
MLQSTRSSQVEVLQNQNQALMKELEDAERRAHDASEIYDELVASRGFMMVLNAYNGIFRGSLISRLRFIWNITFYYLWLRFRKEWLRPASFLIQRPKLAVRERHDNSRQYHSFALSGITGEEGWQENLKSLRKILDSLDEGAAEWEASDPEKTWREFLGYWKSDYLTNLKPHNMRDGALRIAVFTTGGVGDAIQNSPFLAALKRKFTPCEIVLFHTRQSVSEIYEGNRIIVDAIGVADVDIRRSIRAMIELQYFDLVVDVRYAPFYFPCKNSRIKSLDDRLWLEGNWAAIPLMSRFMDNFPEFNNAIGRAVRPFSVLDLIGNVSGLPVDSSSPLYFFPKMQDAGIVEQLGLIHPYVTVHDGMDQFHLNQLGIKRGTKQLPVERWAALIEEIKKRGIYVVQVGASAESKIPGVDFDLRGQTTLSELCFVLKRAVLHIDTEGGVVHLARAANKRSVVLFGPTNKTYFSYPENYNIASTECGDCWWMTNDWSTSCPLGLERPRCMDTVEVSSIPEIIKLELSRTKEKKYQLLDKSLFDASLIDREKALLDMIYTSANMDYRGLQYHHKHAETGAYIHASKNWEYLFALKMLQKHFGTLEEKTIADVGAGRGAQVFGLARQGANVDVFDIDFLWDHQDDKTIEDRFLAAGNRVANISFGSIFNIPANSGSYDAVLCISVVEHIVHKQAAISELLRLLKVGGVLVLTFDLVGDLEQHKHLLDNLRTEIFDAQSLGRHVGSIFGKNAIFTPDEIEQNAIDIQKAEVLGIPQGMTVGGIALVRTA